MIKKKSEVPVQYTENMRGGSGTVKMEQVLDKEKNEFNGKGRIYSKITLKPGCSVGYHIHEGEMECYYILKGSGLYDDNGSETAVSQGDVTLTRSGEGHGIINTGDEDLEMMALILYN
jgi:quercetin dioxygenase-like cupin family protein